jgi:hypothetical protein
MRRNGEMAKQLKRGLLIVAVVTAFVALSAVPASAKVRSPHLHPDASWGEL